MFKPTKFDMFPALFGAAVGLTFGGIGVGIWQLIHPIPAFMTLALSTTTYVISALGGLLAGGILGVAGGAEPTFKQRLGAVVQHTAVWAVPMLLVGWLLAGWMSVLPLTISLGKYFGASIALLWSVAGLTWIGYTYSLAARFLRTAMQRWSQRTSGTALVLAGGLLSMLLWPHNWSFAAQLGASGLVALGVIGPVVTAVLHRWPLDIPAFLTKAR